MTDSTKVPTTGRASVDEPYDPPGVECAVRQNCRSGKRFVDGTEDVARKWTMTAIQERRRHPRIAVSWPVRVWIDDEALQGRAEDASRHGL